MAHNFDVYHPYLDYVGGAAHAWTELAVTAVVFYSQMGTVQLSPPGALASEVHQAFGPYEQDPNATWEACVRDGLCVPAGLSTSVRGLASRCDWCSFTDPNPSGGR